jgi:hypothetical protein
MGEIVNLNKRRKQAERLRKEHLAAQNRRKFGRSKVERAKDQDKAVRQDRAHEGHRVEE